MTGTKITVRPKALRNQLGQAVWLDGLECVMCGHKAIGRLVHIATGLCGQCYRAIHGKEVER